MGTTNINRVILTGNLTSDPRLRTTRSGRAICDLRIASTARRKATNGDGYEDKPNYFSVTVFGHQAETAARHLSKGRAVAVDGRLDWRQWETPDGGSRQMVSVIADSVQFLGPPDRPGRDDDNNDRLSDSSRPSNRRRQLRLVPDEDELELDCA